MESSRRAVESYWRAKMIDNASADDDKVTPLYKLDEICETLRSVPAGIVKEMADYVFKRLDHRSPRVKQKVLRLIKYCVAKSGVEFRREIQRHSGVIRNLFHYRGEPDALRGDALNKAVRDTAHEALSAIFASDEKQTASDDLSKRIQGFGSTNFDMQPDEKRSFLSDVVEIGSASFKQGLSMIGAQSNNNFLDSRGSSSGAYRGPSLRKSLTLERDPIPRNHREDTWTPPKYLASEHRDSSSSHEPRNSTFETDGERFRGNETKGNSREERLLDSITAAGGVRLQPSRDAIQNFITIASRMDSKVLCEALDGKIQSHVWQVRFKALCVLESLLRHKDDPNLEEVYSFFSQYQDAIVTCKESPQASLREKANRVLSLFEGSTANTTVNTMKSETIEIPDLIDTGEADLLADEASLDSKPAENQNLSNFDLLGSDVFSTGDSDTTNKQDNPFVGLSVHSQEAEGNGVTNDLFSGLMVGDSVVTENSNNDRDLFGNLSQPADQKNQKSNIQTQNLDDIFGSLSISQPPSGDSQKSLNTMNSNSGNVLAGTMFADQNLSSAYPTFNNFTNSQAMGVSSSIHPPAASLQNMPANMMMQQLQLQAMNFGQFGNQQQLLALMANFPQLSMGMGAANMGLFQTDNGFGGGSQMLSDGFDFSGDPTSNHIPTTDLRQADKTKAFDFIADHISAAKSTKKIT